MAGPPSGAIRVKSPAAILAERNLIPNKALGQHFLVEPGTIAAIVAKAGPRPGVPILEIGPGLGALTIPLLEKGCQVIAVEMDRGLAAYLEEEVAMKFHPRLTVLNQDILKTRPADLKMPADTAFLVMGNLPYQISSPILFKLFEWRNLITKAVLMFQREVADRLSAGPGTKDYSRLSVFFQHFASVRILHKVGPSSFYPRPKVGSAVVEVQFKAEPDPSVDSMDVFTRLVKAGFSQRRKMLKNCLKTEFKESEFIPALEAEGIEPARRAETLTPTQFVNLANKLTAARPPF